MKDMGSLAVRMRALVMLRGGWPYAAVAGKTGLPLSRLHSMAARDRRSRLLPGKAVCPGTSGPIEFERVPAYRCPGCRRRVEYRPCVVCAAVGGGEPNG